MKNKFSLLLGLVALIFAGCTKDIDDIGITHIPGIHHIHIEGSINQEYVSRVNDGGFCTGDQIGLFGVNYTNNNTLAGTLLDEGNQVDNARYTFNAEEWTWTSGGGVYYKDSKTNIDLYGYYPYANVESVNAYIFEVQRDQSGENSVDGYGLSDFLWGKATNIAPSEAKVKITFNHKLSCANVILVEDEGFADGEFEALKKSVLVMNTSRKAEIDLATGVVTAVGDAESEGIVMKSNNEGYRAIVVPQTVEAGASLFSITVDGVSYRFKYQQGTSPFTFESGKQAKFTISIKKKVPSGDYEFTLTDCDIVDWIADIDTHGGEARQYYVVHCEEPGTLEEMIALDGRDATKIKNLKVSGKINAADFCFMRNSMVALQAVNLKETTIDATWTCTVKFEDEDDVQDRYFKGVMPSNEDECRAIVAKYYPNKVIDYWASTTQVNLNDEIPQDALLNKSYLTHFEFPAKLTKIKASAFRRCHLLSGTLIIPDDVIEIERDAFSECKNVSSISLPKELKKIGNAAFSGCTSWSGNLNLPENVFSIEGDAFEDCKNLSGTLQLPNGLTNLGIWAFKNCKGFTGNLTIPEGITILNYGIFSGCTGLNGQLILHDNIQIIDGRAFTDCNFQGELKLPEKLEQILSYAFWNCKFSSIAGFPEGLIEIGDNAFRNNWRLSGVLEFPESLISIGEGAFATCDAIDGIILPPNLAVIKDEAFIKCYNINKIVCQANEPPMVLTGAFDGVSKNNFTVEVPEQSVNRYQNDTKWGEFERIGAHHDFSISRREIRTLNAGQSRELVLRAPAELEWSIESKPDWVTVSPSSGVGKQKVVISINEMTATDVATFKINTGTYNSPKYETHNGRAGEVVFLLNKKEYRSTLKVEQYDYEYGDGDMIVNQTASEGNGVNIVFMGDCFDARDIAMGSYLDGINEAIGYYFDIEPYKTYKPYFNIYTVVGMSNDSGMRTVNTIRDAKFGSQYSLDGISPNHEITYEYAMKTATVNEDNLGQTLVVMIENTTEYGGICYMWGDGSAIACCPMSDDAYPYDFRGIVQHEAGGHGFGKLADEYIYTNGFISACTCPNKHLSDFNAYKALGWYRNLESVGDMEKVGWSHLIFNPKYSNIVDIYEGGYFHSRGIFRSEPNSCMNNNIPYYSAISRQEMVERIMRYAGKEFDINEFYANDVLDSQGNNTGATRSSVAETAITLTGAGKQMPPKFMGDKPQLKKSNK